MKIVSGMQGTRNQEMGSENKDEKKKEKEEKQNKPKTPKDRAYISTKKRESNKEKTKEYTQAKENKTWFQN